MVFMEYNFNMFNRYIDVIDIIALPPKYSWRKPKRDNKITI
jgi:hypothetical protein